MMKLLRDIKPNRPVLTLTLALAVWLFSGLWVSAQQTGVQELPTDVQLIAYLNQTLDWHRQIAVEEQLASEPADNLFVFDSKNVDTQIVRLSFDFAKATATVISNPSTPAPSDNQEPGRYQSFQRAASAAEAEVRQTQSEIESLKISVGHSPRTQTPGPSGETG